MKYKVIYFESASGKSGATSASFYTRNQATESAQQWRALGSTFYAYLWDGSSWTAYEPIP